MKLRSAILFTAIGSASAAHSSDEKFVSCGSSVKLTHIESGGKFFLSSDERQLQSGSGQQLVTASSISNSHNALWQVREANGVPHCDTAAPIKCGAIIRLTHLNTNNNLHTHGIKSPLSNQHEVTGFGNGSGEGDSGDDWKVMCSGGEEYWLRGGEVSFRSTATSRYLGAASNIRFSEQNCGRGCPILNHLEVFGRQQNDQHTKWKTDVGVYLYK
eukprot:CCRYP_015045-RA/>CCRYP_015045-RA protein AED:0.42 eAED:0.42 QI:0/0.5/0.33/1/1/1/3/76/214